MARTLGGAMTGPLQGTPYEIVALRGHLYEYAEPREQVAPNLATTGPSSAAPTQDRVKLAYSATLVEREDRANV
ncbi:hypothetical protein ACIRCZ_18875 [Leifsonia sp. NPDC102414]|uniref:hypothetical protein n=1 Tax=Leifsonia sp. NPDC102414 TaxID=3364124 RepID=UPI00380B2A5E